MGKYVFVCALKTHLLANRLRNCVSIVSTTARGSLEMNMQHTCLVRIVDYIMCMCVECV